MQPDRSEFCSKVPRVLLTSAGARAPQKSSEICRPHQSVTCPALAKEEQPVTNNGVEGTSTETAEFLHFLLCFGWWKTVAFGSYDGLSTSENLVLLPAFKMSTFGLCEAKKWAESHRDLTKTFSCV